MIQIPQVAAMSLKAARINVNNQGFIVMVNVMNNHGAT